MSYFTCSEIRLPNKRMLHFISENTSPITRFYIFCSIGNLENYVKKPSTLERELWALRTQNKN